MSDPYRVPETILDWVNVRLQKTEQAFQLQGVEFGDDGAVRVDATVQKFMMSAEVQVTGRLAANGGKLVVEDLKVDTKNPMIQGLLKQFLPVLVAKARESLGKYDVEIAEPAGADDEGEGAAEVAGEPDGTDAPAAEQASEAEPPPGPTPGPATDEKPSAADGKASA